MSIGKAILRIRTDKGMTQSDVGRRSGLATSYVFCMENDRLQPTMGTLGRVAEALEVPVSSIFRLHERGSGPVTHRCPVSTSGDCIGELLRSDRGRRPLGKKVPYGREELELLRMADYLVLHGTKEARRALRVLLEALVSRETKPPRGRATG